MVRDGTTLPVSAQLVNGGDGTFHLFFPATQAGDYTITLQTSGRFSDSYGSMGTFQRTVDVEVQNPTTSEFVQALAGTGFYLLCLLLVFYTVRYLYLPHPFGGYQSSQDGVDGKTFEFSRARRGLAAFFRPDRVYSQEVKMPRGLLLRFIRGGSIEVRPDGANGKKWSNQGRELDSRFQNVSELWFDPPDGSHQMTSYTIRSVSTGAGKHSIDKDESQELVGLELIWSFFGSRLDIP